MCNTGNSLADAIREARMKRGITQDELAKKLYVSQQVVSRWETGDNVPSASSLVDIDRILDTCISVKCADTDARVVVDGEVCSEAEAAAIAAARAVNESVDAGSLLTIMREGRGSVVSDTMSMDDHRAVLEEAMAQRLAMSETLKDIRIWCAKNVPDEVANFRTHHIKEIKRSCDESGHVTRGTRLGMLNRDEFELWQEYVAEGGFLFNGAKQLSRDDFAKAMLMTYGKIPVFLDTMQRFFDDVEAWHLEQIEHQDSVRRNLEENGWYEYRYANGGVCRADLVRFDDGGTVVSYNHVLDFDILVDYLEKGNVSLYAEDAEHFSVIDRELFSADGTVKYIYRKPNARREIDVYDEMYNWVVSDEFYAFLISCDTWDDLAGGHINDMLLYAML